MQVSHERLDCVLALITSGATIDAKDNAGNTALHLAVLAGNTSIVRALLVFEADFAAVNEEGDTAGQIATKKMEDSGVLDQFSKDREGVLFSLYAVGASGCGTPTDKKGQEYDFKKIKQSLTPRERRVRTLFDEMLAMKAKNSRAAKDGESGGGRMLSLDGGGIKGVVLTRMLLSLEKVLEVPITHCFDWITGTSTGGILALALVSGKSVLDCQIMYLKLKDQVFVDSKPYPSKPLEELLKSELGTTTKMYDIKGQK